MDLDLFHLFEMLSYGELSNLSMSGDGSGEILPAMQPKLVHYTNEALLKLYGRFLLKENDVLVQLYEHITFYHLIPRFSLCFVPTLEAEEEHIRYLLDLAHEPFRDEVIKVISVFDNLGKELPLNDEEQHHSVFTPQAKVLQVPNPIGDLIYNVRYQQRHPKLSGELGENIECPDVLLGALTSYIAYKVYSHMNSAESSAKAQEFMATYELNCNDAVDRDLVNGSISQTNVRFERGGWR